MSFRPASSLAYLDDDFFLEVLEGVRGGPAGSAGEELPGEAVDVVSDLLAGVAMEGGDEPVDFLADLGFPLHSNQIIALAGPASPSLYSNDGGIIAALQVLGIPHGPQK